MALTPEQQLEAIKKYEADGYVLYEHVFGASASPLDAFINQPTEGLLYDLNRDKATCATWIREGKESWVNNYAVALVISRLKERLEEAETKLKKFEQSTFACPDCGYKVNPTEFVSQPDEE